jgi:poly(3-hydroxybutyrate) depolymerase
VNVARGGRGVAEKVSSLATGTAREYVRHDFMLGKKPVVRLCLVKGVGHAWSGGDPDLKFNAREGPKACLLIWQFFMQNASYS